MTDDPETSAFDHPPEPVAFTRAPDLPPLPTFAQVAAGNRSWFEEFGYTYWNVELLDALADRLRSEASAGWLELAAGTGCLTAELSRRGLEVLATDDYSQSAEQVRSHQRVIRYGEWVERRSARDAVAHYRPVRVICAWPPLGSCLVPDLLTASLPGSQQLRLVICIGDPGGATEAPIHPEELPEGWSLESWPDCERYLVGFNDPLPAGPGFRSNSRLVVCRRD